MHDRVSTKAVKDIQIPKPTGSDPCQLEFDFKKKRAMKVAPDMDIYRDIRYILGTYGVNFDGGI